MKKLIVIAVFIAIAAGTSAQKYITRNGHIGFYSHTPLEDIIADNNQVASILDIADKKMVFQALMKSFIFQKALMQVHFNEEYVNSEKYPKATFEGNIISPADLDLTREGDYDVKVKGNLSMHGVTKEVEEPGKIHVGKDEITANSEFTVQPEDFNIEIPSVVRGKIAKEITVKVDMKYSPMK